MGRWKRGVALGLVVSMAACMLGGCASDTGSEDQYSVTMVSDIAGVNDASFNQSAWQGLQKLQQDTGVPVSYTESKQAGDYVTNLDRSVDQNFDLIWGIGMEMEEPMEREARLNPKSNFGLVDATYEDIPSNLFTVTFKAQDSAFIVGYIAAHTTQTNEVGFIGGLRNSVIEQFEYGYRAGVAYGAAELGKTVEVHTQYAQSFSDAAKAKQISLKMYAEGCDIIFHAAGQSGNGMIAAAQEQDKWAIGVDSDQSYLAPDNVLTSALKRVDNAVYLMSERAMNGEDIFGQGYEFGLKENCVGIPEENKNMSPELYQKTMELEDIMKQGTLTTPKTEEEFNAFIANET